MDKIILIQSSEDGNNITLIDNIEDLLSAPQEYSVEKFLHEWPKEKNPHYWKKGEAILAEIKILKPKIKAVAYQLD